MNRTIKMLAVLMSMTVGAAVHADAFVQARSDVPAVVYLDGQRIGHTPVDIARVRRGSHEIRFRAIGSNLEQAFVITAPRHATVIAPVTAHFAFGAPGCHAPVVSVAPIAPVVVTRPVVIAAAPFVVNRYGYRGHRRYWR